MFSAFIETLKKYRSKQIKRPILEKITGISKKYFYKIENNKIDNISYERLRDIILVLSQDWEGISLDDENLQIASDRFHSELPPYTEIDLKAVLHLTLSSLGLDVYKNNYKTYDSIFNLHQKSRELFLDQKNKKKKFEGLIFGKKSLDYSPEFAENIINYEIKYTFIIPTNRTNTKWIYNTIDEVFLTGLPEQKSSIQNKWEKRKWTDFCKFYIVPEVYALNEIHLYFSENDILGYCNFTEESIDDPLLPGYHYDSYFIELHKHQAEKYKHQLQNLITSSICKEVLFD